MPFAKWQSGVLRTYALVVDNLKETINSNRLEIEVRQIASNYPFDLLLLADESIEVINQYIDICWVFGIYFHKTLVGVAALMPLSNRLVELKNIAISEAYQNNGFGRQTIDWLENFCRKMGYQEMLVGTGDASHGQMIFYQKLGFEMHSIRKNFFRANYPKPIYENGLLLRHMIVFSKHI